MDIELLKVLLPFLAAIAPLLAKALKLVPVSWLKTAATGVLSGLLVLAIVQVVDVLWKPEIKIDQPSDGSAIQCNLPSRDIYCRQTVFGTAKGPLKAEDKIYVFIQEKGGNEWWISGGAIQVVGLRNGKWSQPAASFGEIDLPAVGGYEICALLTKEEYSDRRKFPALPDVKAVDCVGVNRS